MLTILCLQGFEFDIFVEANYKLVLSWTCSWDEVEYVDKDLLEHLDTAISRSLSLPAPATGARSLSLEDGISALVVSKGGGSSMHFDV